jgi:RNA polymerase sigma-70 factor (ECF subfamily)
MKERSNREWLDDLRGPGRDVALADLRAFLLRGLGYSLANRSDVDGVLIEDFVQDALLKVLDSLDTFRGESRFTTWAQKIAVRAVLTELRRRPWRDLSLEAMTESQGLDFTPDSMVAPEAPPDQKVVQRLFLETLQRLMATKLTDKQRQALVAVRIHGIPPAAVARRMGTNRSALNKLLHDARQRLKDRMAAELRQANINVNCVLPGTIYIPQNRQSMPKADHSRWVPPEAIADVILFLASDAAGAVNGAAVPVYGQG